MERDLLEQISYDYPQLEMIETTDQRNGYPSCLRCALIGFENWGEIEQIQKEYDVDEYPQIFTKRDGWNLWYRTNDTAFEPFVMDSDIQNDYGDDYTIFNKENYLDDIIDTITTGGLNERYDEINYTSSIEDIKQFVEDNKDSDDEDTIDDMEQITELIENYEELCREEEIAGNDAFVLMYCGEYYDTIPCTAMDTYFDTKYHAIGFGEDL